MAQSASMNPVTVGNFVVNGATQRQPLLLQTIALKNLYDRVVEESTDFSGRSLISTHHPGEDTSSGGLFGVDTEFGPRTPEELAREMAGLEKLAETEQTEMIEADQRGQLEAAGVTMSPGSKVDHIFSTGAGDDQVTILESEDGRRMLMVNGHEIQLTREQSDAGILDTGDGDDTIVVQMTAGRTPDERLRAPDQFTIDAGAGDDTLTGGAGHDILVGGAGDDVIHGGAGDDDIEGGAGDDQIFGEAGLDSVYGGTGDDVLSGGGGNDYLEGQGGSDQVSGDGGDDVLGGGDGDDQLDAGLGRDVVFTGEGADEVEAGQRDTIYAGPEATLDGQAAEVLELQPVIIPDNIFIEGSEEFVERTNTDLETLGYTPEGRLLLEQIGESGHVLTISDVNETGAAYPVNDQGDLVPDAEGPYLTPSGTPGPSYDSVIGFNPRHPIQIPVGGNGGRVETLPRSIVLAHELIHAQQQMTGTAEPGQSPLVNSESGPVLDRNDAPNAELDTVGLPFDQDRDNDGVPDPAHPFSNWPDPNQVTENDFRVRFHIAPRTEY